MQLLKPNGRQTTRHAIILLADISSEILQVQKCGHGGSLVDSSLFVQRVVGSNPTLAASWGPWVSLSLAVACGALA